MRLELHLEAARCLSEDPDALVLCFWLYPEVLEISCSDAHSALALQPHPVPARNHTAIVVTSHQTQAHCAHWWLPAAPCDWIWALCHVLQCVSFAHYRRCAAFSRIRRIHLKPWFALVMTEFQVDVVLARTAHWRCLHIISRTSLKPLLSSKDRVFTQISFRDPKCHGGMLWNLCGKKTKHVQEGRASREPCPSPGDLAERFSVT